MVGMPTSMRGKQNVHFSALPVLWLTPLRHDHVLFVLHNPRYAGAYSYRRRRQVTDAAGHHRILTKARKDWTTLIPDAHPGYISWDQPGAVVYVADPAGSVTRWRVVGLDVVIKAALPKSVFAGPTGPRQLVLVTCGGPIRNIPGVGNTYRDNVIVTAVPV